MRTKKSKDTVAEKPTQKVDTIARWASTPSTLKGAIENGIKEAELAKSSERADIIYMHVRDRLAQDFGAALLYLKRYMEPDHATTIESVIQLLWNQIFSK